MRPRTPQSLAILMGCILMTGVPAAAQKPDDETRLYLTELTLPFPREASVEATQRGMAQGQKIMSRVHQCEDLLAEARSIEGATAGALPVMRAGDLKPNRRMYEEVPKLAPGGAAGPFRVAEGFQIIALCSKSDGK